MKVTKKMMGVLITNETRKFEIGKIYFCSDGGCYVGVRDVHNDGTITVNVYNEVDEKNLDNLDHSAHDIIEKDVNYKTFVSFRGLQNFETISKKIMGTDGVQYVRYLIPYSYLTYQEVLVDVERDLVIDPENLEAIEAIEGIEWVANGEENAAVVDEVPEVVMVDYEDDGSNDDPDEESILDELGIGDEEELIDKYAAWKDKVTPYTYHALMVDRKGNLTFDGKRTSRDKAAVEIRRAANRYWGRENYKDIRAILFVDAEAMKYLLRATKCYYLPYESIGNLKFVDFGRDEIPYINQKVADTVSWYQDSAQAEDEEKAAEIAYKNSLEYKLKCWDVQIREVEREIEYQNEDIVASSKHILFCLSMIAEYENSIQECGLMLDQLKKDLSFRQGVRKAIADQIATRNAFNAINAAAADMADDGSNDDPDEDSVLDTVGFDFDDDDENEDDDELIDEPAIAGKSKVEENTGAKFEVGKVYVLHDICYTVTKRTEKFVTFKHQTAQSAVLDYYKEVVTRKAIDFDDDGNEVVYGLSAFGRLESTVDLATYEKLFNCKLTPEGKFVSYNWNDENTINVEFEDVVVESEVDAAIEGETAEESAVEEVQAVAEIPQVEVNTIVEFAIERFTDFDLVAEINSMQTAIRDTVKKLAELRERRRQLLELEFGTDYCKSRPCSGSKPLFEYVDAILTPLVFEQICPTKFISQDGKIWDMAKTGYITIIEPRSAKPLTVDKLQEDDTYYCYVMRGFSTPSATYCEYSTLKQFRAVIQELAAAIKRGDKEYIFPADTFKNKKAAC